MHTHAHTHTHPSTTSMSFTSTLIFSWLIFLDSLYLNFPMRLLCSTCRIQIPIRQSKSENHSISNMRISRWHELSSCYSNYLSISYKAEWVLWEKLQEYFPRSLPWPTGYRHFYSSSNSRRKSCQDRICTDISYISLEGSSHWDVKLPLLLCWA